MADKKPNPTAPEDFDRFLSACPEADGDNANTLRVMGSVLRSKKPGHFVLQTGDNSMHEIPRDAVESFNPLNMTGARMAELVLRREGLGADLAGKLGQLGGGFKVPTHETLKEQPYDTLKEIGGGDHTLKEQPYDTLKEIGGGDTLKEQPYDTLKELGGGDTLKEQPYDTLKEIGGGDTLKEQPYDTLKEIGGGDTLKEQPFDTLKEVGGGDTLKEQAGEGTGAADTLAEGLGGIPGGGVIQPELQFAQARMAGAAGATALASPQLKPIHFETIKEASFDHTFKELIGDKYLKEIVKEIPKEVAWDGPGGGNTLIEGRPDWGSLVNPAINPGNLGLAVPFVLATPHQASQGAVAQQMLAAQVLQGRLGY